MKVLLCHNHYLQPGGEDQVFADEAALLESQGCDVLRYTRHSRDTESMGRVQTAKRVLWNAQTFDELRAIIRSERPDVMHCTNLFPLISPAAYDAAQSEELPIVQSLHNFRSICANGLLMRDGVPCEKCVGRNLPWQGVAHKCYRDSHLASAVLATSITRQRMTRDRHDPVSRYIALSEFSRQKFIQAGFAPERIAVKPNFVSPDPGVGDGFGDFAVFVGRLSSEKGIDVLLDAWKLLKDPIRLIVVGDGPLGDDVRTAADHDTRINWLGRQPIDEIYRLLGEAAFLVLPSRCYENCPKTILEAYSKGTPVVASRLGAMAEFVADGHTGRHFTAGDPAALATVVRTMFRDVAALTGMRLHAREEYEAKYTAAANYRMLRAIYDRAIRGADPAEGDAPSGTTVLPIADPTTPSAETVG